ncbi:MAG: TonB-dependent receptor [Gammaproteobacteria bacterium]|nr:TonB-dependent receptor [Gammaproteobacteria bacterium]|tara:strand:- start:100 stop:3123 length:3024 start_codon:yes stop_codon:yes gene_type:complete
MFQKRPLAAACGSLVAGGVLFAAGLTVTGAAYGEEAAGPIEEVVVTGTRIQTAGNLVETSPVTAISAEEFNVRGVLQVEDMINTLPQAFGAQGSNLANGATGTSSVDLRGLGEERTLVLMNGRRLPYGSLNTPAPDVNFIPAALVERVDILTGGASATYGSDAIAGVVNFVLNDDFEGLKFDGNFSTYQHNNNGSTQDLLEEFNAINPGQFAVPDGSTTNGDSFDLTVSFGSSFGNGQGHFMGFLGYQETDPILQGDYDYAQCALGTRNNGEEFTCSGSSTNEIANLLNVGTTVTLPDGWARVTPDGEFAPRDFTTDTFNFNPFNHYQRPNERLNGGMFVNYEFNENVEAYAEFMYMNNETNSQIAPSGIFGYGVAGGNGGINCNNPYLSDQQFDFLCGSQGLTEDDIADGVLILRRNVEGGERNNDIQHTTARFLGGLRGLVGETQLTYDVYASYSRVRRSEIYNNDLSINRITKALYAVEDPDTGAPVCRVNVDDDPTNDDPNCVPYDAFTGNPPDPAAVSYLAIPLQRDGTTEQTVISGQISGSLDEWDIRVPSAQEALAFAAGIEYREDKLDSNPDLAFQTGDGAGQGGPTNPVSGTQDVIDLFLELNVPLVQGAPGVEHLGVDGAYRYSDYDDFTTDSYKFGADYAPTNDIRFRASYQRAVRAPNIFELFDPQGISLFDLTEGPNGLYDPCSGPTPTATFEQCARTGVTAAQYGNIADNPAGQFNNLEGGNPDLDPEKSDTYTVGFVLTPSAIEGLTVSVDYFDISLEGRIDNVDENLALSSCLETGDPFFCSLINRGAGGTLWANQTGYVIATDVNTGELSTKGIDVLANYGFTVGDMGFVEVDYVATFLDELEEVPLPDSGPQDIYDCAGFYGGPCGAPNPEYRHKLRATWETPWDVALTATWRRYGEVDVAQSSDQPGLSGSFSPVNETFKAQDYFDVSGTWRFNEAGSVTAGINNLFDNDPPLSSIVGTAPGNGNTYPQVYDAFGRYMFLRATYTLMQ